jgi:hypothetical protein
LVASCFDAKKYEMEWIGWASKGLWKEPAKFMDEFSLIRENDVE